MRVFCLFDSLALLPGCLIYLASVMQTKHDRERIVRECFVFLVIVQTMSCCYHPSTANLDTKNCEAIMCDKLKTLKPVSQVF